MASTGQAPPSDPRALASFARSPKLPPASVWGAKRSPVGQSRLGLSNSQNQIQSAGWTECLYSSSSSNLPVTSCALRACFWVCCCTVHTTSCQIDQTIALSVFRSISKLVGKPVAGCAQRCLSRVAESRWVSKARKREGRQVVGRTSRKKMGEEERRQNKGQLDGKGCLAQGDGIVL